jgi:hypothetical protein
VRVAARQAAYRRWVGSGSRAEKIPGRALGMSDLCGHFFGGAWRVGMKGGIRTQHTQLWTKIPRTIGLRRGIVEANLGS